MKRFLIAAIIAWSMLLPAQGQNERPTYKTFRFDEDWSHLANSSNYSDWLDPLKYIGLGRPGWFITLGGEIHEKFELLDQPGFGMGPNDPYGYFLQRYLLSSDFHFGPRLRVFTELQSGLEEGRIGGPRPTDVDELDLHQAFLDWRVSTEKRTSLTIRLGRQEVGFGSGRLIAPAEGLNLRRSMDGGRIIANLAKVSWSASALRLVLANRGIFDDVPDHSQTMLGTGVEAPWVRGKSSRFAPYYVRFDKKSSTFVKGVGHEIRNTAGLHVWNLSAMPWTYDYECVLQWGSFQGTPIRAWALSEDTGYTFDQTRLHTKVGLRADIASGDRGKRTRTLGTFNPLFPAVAEYSGPSALLGAENLVDITPSVHLRLNTDTELTLESSSFWRQNLYDSVYTPFNTPVRNEVPNTGRYVATAPTATLSWRATRHLFYSVIYTRWLTGDYFHLAAPNQDVNYVGAWVSYRF